GAARSGAAAAHAADARHPGAADQDPGQRAERGARQHRAPETALAGEIPQLVPGAAPHPGAPHRHGRAAGTHSYAGIKKLNGPAIGLPLWPPGTGLLPLPRWGDGWGEGFPNRKFVTPHPEHHSASKTRVNAL